MASWLEFLLVQLPADILVLSRWQRVPHATNYQVFTNASDPTDPAAWQLVAYTSSSRYTVGASESGKFYFFGCRHWAAKGCLAHRARW